MLCSSSQVSISFGSRVDDLLIEQGHVVGLKISDSRDRPPCPGRNASYDAVILAVGHSARDVYQTLLSHNVELVPKDFSVSVFSNLSILLFQRHKNQG